MKLIDRVLLKFEKEINAAKVRRLMSYLKHCGDNVKIDSTCYIFSPQMLEIGDNTSISSFTTIYARYGVSIGNNCLISSNCGISSYNHIQISRNRHNDVLLDETYSEPVIIKNNVWIGMNVCILPGVVIEDNSIVGSGSVVTKNVPKDEIWVGNPAKFLKKIPFDL